MIASDELIQLDTELLSGDAYAKENKTSRMRALSVMAHSESEQWEKYCCSNLSYVVRSDTFRSFLERGAREWNSLYGMTADLWPICSKQRVYKVVNVRLLSKWEFLVLCVIGKLPKQLLLREGRIRWFMKWKTGQACAVVVFMVYRRMPDRLKKIVRIVYGGWNRGNRA